MAELSGFEVLVLAKEIDSALSGTYVNNIYRLGNSQLIRLRKPGEGDVWVVASPSKGVWVSKMVSERTETTEFTSKLRSELERAKFVGASQYGLDRVFFLDFDGEDRKRLIVEMLPPGNIVVTDRLGKVRLALSEVRARTRRVVKGSEYEPPRQSRQGPLEVTGDDLAAFVRQETTAGRAIGRHVALPRKYVAEALTMLGVTDDSPAASLRGRESEVVEVLREMVGYATGSPEPCICTTPDGDEIFVFRPKDLEVKEATKTVSELCDRLFLAEAAGEKEEGAEDAKKRELSATIAKLGAEAESLALKASKVREAAMAGTLSTEEAAELLKASGRRSIKPLSSPAAVASALYDWAKVLERRSEESREAASRLQKRLEKSGPAAPSRTRPILRRQLEWYEKFRWFYTGKGRLAIGGRDAQSNSLLLRRHLDSTDTVFHADLFGSPFFVLKGSDARDEDEIREVAQATVAFSSAWKTGLGSADAFWVTPDQVSSAAPSGEYLPRGSYSIKGKKNFVTKLIVEVAVGVDGEGRVTSGPEDAVKKRCPRYVVLRPHNEKGSETAKRVLKDLGPVPGGEISLDQVQRALPSGGGKIIRRV